MKSERKEKCSKYETDSCTLYCDIWRSGGCPYAVLDNSNTMQGENRIKFESRMFKVDL